MSRTGLRYCPDLAATAQAPTRVAGQPASSRAFNTAAIKCRALPGSASFFVAVGRLARLRRRKEVCGTHIPHFCVVLVGQCRSWYQWPGLYKRESTAPTATTEDVRVETGFLARSV